MDDAAAEGGPIARSPIRPTPPVAVVGGWEVSRRQSAAALTLSDRSPLAKVLVHADSDSEHARATTVAFGRAAHVGGGVLEIGSGVGEWLLLGPVGSARDLMDRVAVGIGADFVSVVDLTHGRALVRLTGDDAAALLSKLCGVDLDDSATPNLTAFRSLVAKVVADVVRDDVQGTPSYLVHCERALGQYMFDVLVDAGVEFGVDVSGFVDDRSD